MSLPPFTDLLSPMELTGRSRSHVVQWDQPRFAAQPAVSSAFLAMRKEALQAGFDLRPFSSFRDFDTQVRIWNAKVSGKKPLYDQTGVPRDFASLDDTSRIWAILEWSALPGSSRHHWGTEIDVVDANAMDEDYRVRLLPQEVVPGGIFRPMHDWLDVNMARFGFFRPYDLERGGMHPEPWHLSFAELSRPALAQLSLEIVAEAIAEADLEGRELIETMLPDIFERHILNIA